jgi:sec-independent protein translocase protein TatB
VPRVVPTVVNGVQGVFDLSITKLLILAVIALVIFGPNELPRIASQAGKALRDLRRIAEGAKEDLREGLGPEFSDFDFEDLNPRRFVQKHLIEGFDDTVAPAAATAAASRTNGSGMANGAAANGSAANGSGAANGSATALAPGQRPPFDMDAT